MWEAGCAQYQETVGVPLGNWWAEATLKEQTEFFKEHTKQTVARFHQLTGHQLQPQV